MFRFNMYLNISLIILLIIFICAINNVTSANAIARTNPVYIITLTSNILDSSSECRSELEVLREAIDDRKLWGLKVLDANGNPTPGFIYGNRFWLGQKAQCFDLGNHRPLELTPSFLKNNSLYRNVNDEFPPYEILYFIARFRHNSTIQYHVRMPNEDIITLGLCLPASCTTHELADIFNEIFKQRTLPTGDFYSADFSLLHVKDLHDDYRWLFNWHSIIVVTVVVIIGSMVILGTGHDVLIHQKRLTRKIRRRSLIEDNDSQIKIKTFLENGNNDVSIVMKNPSMLEEILLCFSLYSNSKMIFNTTISPDSISAIHGLRFFGMLWIILIHTVIYMNDYIDNRVTAWRHGEGLGAQIISNGFMSVDTFFCLGGFLVAWLFFKDRCKKREKNIIITGFKWMDFIGLIVKRLIRLTPAYMIVLGIIEMFTGMYENVALFQISEKPQEMCAKYWWRNMLYINNLFDKDEMCLSWSWYISNDMQFFIIGISLLLISDIHFSAATLLLMTALIGSTLTIGYISYTNEFIFTPDDLWNKVNIIYDPPWIRIGPYLVGIIAAYILIRLNGKLVFKRRTLCLLWIIGSSCNILTLFGTTNRRALSVVTSALHVALGRTIWGIGIAWILIACHTNNAGIINKFLSLKAWIPMSRMTYGAYLLNPIIVSTTYVLAESPVHLDYAPACATYFGNIFVTYVLAYVLTLTLETPFILLQKVLMKPRSRYE